MARGLFSSLRAAKGSAENADGKPVAAHSVPGNATRKLALLSDYEKSGAGWFWETDADGHILYISDHIAEVLGRDADTLRTRTFQSLFVTAKEGDDESSRSVSLLFGGRKKFAGVVVRAAAESSEVYWTVSGRPQFDEEGHFTGYRGHGADVTENQKAENEASHLARFDSLTGLANRHRMDQKIDATLLAFRSAKRACAIMMIDLDRFKQVNDSLGHRAGDELLKQVSQRLKRVFDKSCEVARVGGDEFLVMLPDVDDRGALGEIAKRAIAMVTQPYSLEEGRCAIGASIGIAIAPYDGVTREEVTHSADTALYAAKNGGRGQFRFFSSELQKESHLRKQLERDLGVALEKGQLTLEYQPIIANGNDRIIAMEALLRWYHPERGKISPAIFLPIAEESNLINSIGEWVLRKACEDAVRWPDDVRVCVNISEQQIITPGFSRTVANALANAGLEPERLECELKESAHFGEGDSSQRELKALRRLGVRLSLDDFGTGMSSLGYLRRAPFETIKIDPEFLRGAMDEGSRNPALIGAIVALAKALGIETVAEGIEAMDELKLVRDCGVDHVQGFVYCSPMPSDEADEFLTEQGWEISPNGPEKQRSERRKVYRKVHVIHEDHYYDVVLRDLSRSGAMIQGLLDVPAGTQFVVDFGEGQLAVAKVERSHEDQQGLSFETPLVDDGAGGLCTRNRISPYALAAAGMPLAQLPPGHYPLAEKAENPQMLSMPRFGQRNLKAKLGS